MGDDDQELMATARLHLWEVPSLDGEALKVEASAGHVVTIVGANGSGKSALATWMFANAPQGLTRRLIAHRRLWFEHAGPEMSAAQREQITSAMAGWDRNPDSRYLDHAHAQRAGIALFDLLGSINDQNREIADLALDHELDKGAIEAKVGYRRMTQLNDILARAGLLVELTTTADQTFMASRHGSDVYYPIYKMSDGEKSALLLAAEVLTARPRQVVIIDEPERHMHRSISAGMIEAVIAARPDCSFVLLTHDLDLASSTSSSAGASLVVQGCTWSESGKPAWRLRQVPKDADLPELARSSILGGRRRILFVEGVRGGIDVGLYNHLYPGWTIVPSGGCESVMRAVKGMRQNDDLHWVDVAGIVDGDGRSTGEIESLFTSGVRALPVNEIENLFYLSPVLEAVATRQAEVFGDSAESLVHAAKAAAIREIRASGTIARIAAKLARDEIARGFTEYVPKRVDVADLEITIKSPFARIQSELNSLVASDNYEGVVRRVPVRDTGIRNGVAKALRFQSVADYQSAARMCILTSVDLCQTIVEMVGEIPFRGSASVA